MANILVVDDDSAIRQLLTDVLEMDGHDVRVAANGVDGLKAFEALRPDFVVLDVMMPGLDGYGVLRAIRGQEGDPVPVLMLTAAGDAGSAARAWADGVDYYLAKPFTADEVLYLIDGVLQHPVPAAETQACARYARSQGFQGVSD
jgi:DNA-binding response OmpR family regulator